MKIFMKQIIESRVNILHFPLTFSYDTDITRYILSYTVSRTLNKMNHYILVSEILQ